MNTNELVALLSVDARNSDYDKSQRQLLASLGLGALMALTAMLMFYGIRSDIGHAVYLPAFWFKQAFPSIVLLLSVGMLFRVAYPGRSPGLWGKALWIPFATAWVVAGLSLAMSDPQARWGLVLGATWARCSLDIAFVAIPALITTLWAVRQLAPVRLDVAGAAAGLFAGSAGAAAYALHCQEMEAPFVAVWYMVGISIPVLAGWLLGPRLLRW